MTDRLKALHQLWRDHYRKRPYASLLSKAELDQRIRDVVNNLLILTPEAKIGLSKPSHASMAWMETFTHLLEEMNLRHGPYPAGFTNDIFGKDPLPQFVSELAAKAASRLNPGDFIEGNVLIKYGKRERIEALHTHGSVRLQPASYFNGESHNGAVRDDEKTIRLSLLLTRDEIVSVVRNPQDVSENAPPQRMDIEMKHPSDFWIYCVSKSIQPRMFVDFDADACLIIRRPVEFGALLGREAPKALGNAAMKSGPAKYIDPLWPDTTKVDIPMAKDFRYSYQKEYRYCWFPNAPQPTLKHIDISLGSLEEISELVVL